MIGPMRLAGLALAAIVAVQSPAPDPTPSQDQVQPQDQAGPSPPVGAPVELTPPPREAPATATSTQPRATHRAQAPQLPAGPSLDACQRAATRRAQLAPRRARKWLVDARRSAALPTLDATWERRLQQGWRLDREVGAPDELVDDHDANDVWRIKVSWRLDRAWFNPDELRAARAAADLERLRRELLIEVTHLYFERARAWWALRRALSAADPAPNEELAGLRALALELDGMLHAITGLDFEAKDPHGSPGPLSATPGPPRI